MKIEHWDYHQQRVLSECSLRALVEARGYRTAKQVYPPGTHFPDQGHQIDKVDAELAGRVRITLRMQ